MNALGAGMGNML